MLASGDVFAGYVIDRQLGRGGMGSVYLAKHPRLPRMTALKLLNREMFFDKEVRARFEREADLVAQLDHPNIVTVYDRGLEDEQLWISMQFIDGIDAASVQPQALPPQRAVQIIKETADALDYAHGIGVLHRDVKPANILLARSGGGRGERVYLTDFGIARFRDDTGHLTQTGTFTATLAYASPEQLTGASLDHRSDQYSLACSLFWLLTGSGPFAATNPAAVIQGHLQGTAPALSTHRQGLPYALDGVLAKAMAKRPDDRFPTCADFAAAAKQALNAPSAPSMPLAGGPRPYTAPPIPVTGPRPTTAPPIPVTGRPYQHAPTPPTSGPNHLAGQSFPTPPPHTLVDRPQGTGPNPQPTAPYQGPQHQGPQPGYNFTPPPGPPMGIAARPSAGPPRKKSNAGLIIGISVGVVVLILVVLGIIGAVTDDGSTAGTTTTSATKPGTVVDATAESISAEFPRMVPASKTEEVGYNGAKCWETDTSYTPSPGAGDPDFGAWAWQWRCYGGGTNSDPLYRIYVYKSAADAQAVISKLPSNTKAMDSNGGQSYTNYKFDESGPKIVTAFTGDPDRAQYLMFTDGSGTIDEVLRWWRSAPLN
ncbi:serine/threonine-protein kinase [Nocardia brasiliensis]|uniref:serine/threonine-protein kinase n=2 Tax=Nocardia brasiliensis TaxID=37326 RepID=UPI000B51A46C|nr:serine/threonine-protein kinase [Nocardia brasiliensis]ASF11921.1 serine/threonine protein kinase [Nocardia brasiliensis]SUB09219.1 Serine/threonine-protein kinase pknF [Nocardia brasiliensis]